MRKLLHLLSITVILALLSTSAFAQSGTSGTLGDGDDPYLGSTHIYELNIGKVADTRTWELVKIGTPNVTTEITSSLAWATVVPATTDGGKETVTIIYDGTFLAQDYIIKYTEETAECSTTRELPLTVHANQFYLTMESDGADCNFKDGAVIDWAANKDDLVKTTLTFTINMNKELTFTPDSWQFNGTFSLPSNVTIALAGDVKVTSGLGTGTLTVLGAANNTFTLTGLAATASPIVMTVDVSSKVNIGGGIDLTIAGGKALIGSNETPDNLTLGTGDRTQIVTLNPLPAATNISFN